VLLTNDRECYHAALDAHDPANAIRRGEGPSSYPGLNLRCTELQAAVGRVQLRRLDSLVDRTRAHAARIVAAVAEIPDLILRRRNDDDGGNGVAVIFFAPTSASARRMRDELRSAGVPCTCLYEPGVVDLHVSCWWRSTDATLAERGLTPSEAMSLGLLGRAIQVDVHPLFEATDVDAIIDAIRRAAANL
jgi:dTDP-4-amino-4,6-dideoxygalactose transaminase